MLKRKGVIEIEKIRCRIKKFVPFAVYAVTVFLVGQTGAMGGGLLSALLGVVITLAILGAAIPVLWPIAANTTAIDAMSGTDQGTAMIQTFWPIVLLVIGLGLVVGLVIYGMRRFKVGF